MLFSIDLVVPTTTAGGRFGDTHGATYPVAETTRSELRWARQSIRDRMSEDKAGFGLVRIRPLRSNRTIAEPWDEGDGFE